MLRCFALFLRRVTLALWLILPLQAACRDEPVPAETRAEVGIAGRSMPSVNEPAPVDTRAEVGIAGRSMPSAPAPAGANAGNAGRSTPTADEGCPVEVPANGTPCSTTIDLCVWTRGGPCPPNPDQLRKCFNGFWAATAPAIDCRGRGLDDAGPDGG